MKKKNHGFKSLCAGIFVICLICLLFSSVALAWEANLSAFAKNTGSPCSSPNITIGVGDTDILDTPPPPIPSCECKLDLFDYNTANWDRMIKIQQKADKTSYCWIMEVYSSSGSTVMTWDYSNISGGFQLKKDYSCDSTNVAVSDMKSITQYESSGLEWFAIVYTPPIQTHSVNATAGLNGEIEPPGNVSVNKGSNQTFNITPNSGYKIADVKVDNVSVGAVSSYTFQNVVADHTIEVSFAVKLFTITGTINYNGKRSGELVIAAYSDISRTNEVASQVHTCYSSVNYTLSVPNGTYYLR